ncbi:amidohydrolase family protein [Fulvivirga ulvae]|uniref:amidohydrolase family protein n=1 Tax=Fulvivirga ulvae TaxID=2904245 RepID=UPI001F28F24B|nr:amidohydrolase family protein [Fulvivirga ulvae]UII34572.1 amidohydrolase family protein [Fulvivirga ulvae]
MRIDAHQHFWQYHPVKEGWITDDMQVIRRDFMPTDLKPLLDEHALDGCVAVQADQSENETLFLLELAATHDWIKGVIGWLDLQEPDLEEQLAYFKANKHFKGVRHILQAEPKGFMTSNRFVEGVKSVGKHGLTYDILTNETQLDDVLELVRSLPAMPLVIDHISKPDIRKQSFDHWAKYMKILSEYDHVHVKLSGMATEADWQHWTEQDFMIYFDFCLEHFGPKRLMYGSDWPVCLVAGSYGRIIGALQSAVSVLSSEEQDWIMGKTASNFYKLT